MFKLSSKLFANMKLNFEGQPMPLLAVMLSQAQAVPQLIPETIFKTRPEPDQPQDHLSTPPRQQASDPIALVFEHGQSSDPNIASFSRAHETDDEPFTSTNVEDEPLGGSFHASPPRSTQAPPAGHTSGGAEDLITLTALSYIVSTLVQKVNSLETELKAHKKLFKDVVGKLVKKVKAMEVKLKKRKVVVSHSDQEEGGEQAVNLDALIALANAAVTVDSNIPPGGASNTPAASSHIPTDVPTGGDFAPAHSTSPSRDPFKGKGVAKPSSPVSERTKKQLADERLSEIEAVRLEALERERFEKEQAEIARQDAIYAKQLEQEEEMSASQRETRQAEVLSSAKHYSDADWIDIMAQVHANAGLSSELLGADVNDDNFAERMVALINQRKRAFAEQTAKEKRDKPMTPAQQREYMRVFVKNQSTTIYSTGWSMKYVKSLTDEQLIAEFEKIRMAVADLKSQELRRTLKRAGEALEPDTSKKQKSTEAPIPSVPDVPQPPVVSSPKSSGTRRKSLGRSRITKPKSILTELDLDADDKTFIKVVSDEDSEDEAPILWSAFAGWEVISTPLGEINALYMMDQSTKHFTTLREILHMVDRQDLLKLYGLVVKYYENHPVAGAGLVLWGDLQVLMDSQAGGKGSLVWNHQSHWQIRSWRLYTLSNVHVLETISGCGGKVGQKSQSNGGKTQDQEKEGGSMTVDSNIPPGGASNNPAASSHIPTDVPTGGDFAPAHSTSPSRDPFKGKGVAKPSSPVSERTKKQLTDERLSEIEAVRLEALERERFEKEQAEIARQDVIYAKQLEQEEEMSASQRETRQAEVLSSVKHYSNADWIDIMAQVHANAGLSSELLGADVNDDNFAERMVALINQRKRAFAEQTAKEKRDKPMTPAQQREYMRVFVKNQSTTVYSNVWSMKYVKSFTDEQLIAEFEKIRMAVADLKSHELRRTLKRAGEALEPDTSKKQKSTEAPIPSVPDVPQPPVVSSPKSSGTRRKSLGRSRITKPKSILTELDLDADDKTFIKVVSDEDSEDEAPILWSAFAGWEVISTPLGEINALYMMDQSTKHFTTLREILHMVDRQDLLKLYGLVVKYYENHPIAGAGLVLWGDLQVLYMFSDVSYPLSVKLMERMLTHKLEIDKDVVGNDMTTAEQLIRFIKNQLAAAQVSPA
ncbi:hypothetical protein Tco_0287403 [Tanacetum coccineum]